jgi:hypothetical protein
MTEKHNLCTLCGKPIVLVPSALERARKYGGTPAHYRDLFKEHVACTLAKREADTRALLRQRVTTYARGLA